MLWSPDMHFSANVFAYRLHIILPAVLFAPHLVNRYKFSVTTLGWLFLASLMIALGFAAAGFGTEWKTRLTTSDEYNPT